MKCFKANQQTVDTITVHYFLLFNVIYFIVLSQEYMDM